MKKCPYCAEEIQEEAIKCKHCGEWLNKGIERKNKDDTNIKETNLLTPPPLPSASKNERLNSKSINNTSTVLVQNKKSKGVAALLAIFLGGIGIHKFYLDRAGWGIVYLLFCWTFIPMFIGFIEGIIYAAMTLEEFDNKYNKLESVKVNVKHKKVHQKVESYSKINATNPNDKTAEENTKPQEADQKPNKVTWYKKWWWKLFIVIIFLYILGLSIMYYQ